jgi:MFS family permease
MTPTAPDAGRERGLLAVLLAPMFMYQADTTIVNVANPAIGADLHATAAELELVLGGYLLASATMFIAGARLGQMRGYRRMFLLGLALFGVASLLCGLAPTPAALIATRVAQGAGGALMIPQVLTSIQVSFEGRARARALSLYPIALAGGAVVGQLLGGALVSADLFGTGWRPIFLINVPIAVAVLVAGRRLLAPDADQDRDARLDVTGTALLSSALLLIVLPLTLGRQEHWPAWTWICLSASLPLLASFVIAERRISAAGGSPLLHLGVLSRPAIRWGLTPQAIAVSTYYSLLFTLALYLQQGLGHSPLVSGLTLVSWVAPFGVASQIVRRVPATRRPLVAPAGCLLLAGAYAALSGGLFAGEHAEAVLVVLLGAGGLGLGLQFSALVGHLTDAVAPRYAPDISGVSTTVMQIGGAVGAAGFGTLYLALAGRGATTAFAIVAAGLAAVALLAGVAARVATRSPKRVRLSAWHSSTSTA